MMASQVCPATPDVHLHVEAVHLLDVLAVVLGGDGDQIGGTLVGSISILITAVSIVQK